MPSEAVKITCSTEDLDAKLSKSMKALGAHHDQYGRLLNAENQYIAGLSQARIKMGDYVDAQGRMRDANGNFLDGLTATELKLRMYKDELGNVYNAEGELVRQSEAAARAQELLATAGQRGMQSLMSGAEGAAKMANNLSMMIGILGGGNEGLTKLGQNVVIATQTFSQFALAMKTLPKFVNGFKLLAQATQGQTAAQVVLNAVSGNWVAIVAGGLAAGTLAYKTLSSATKKAADVTSEHKEETAELIRKLDSLGIKLKEISAAQAGFRNWGKSETAGIEEATAALEKYDQETEKALKKYQDYHKEHGQVGEAGKLWKEYQSKKEHRVDKEAELANQINQMVAKDLDFSDELTKLKQRADYYQQVINDGVLTGEELVNAQKALENNLAKQKEITEKENEEKEKAAAAEAEKKLAEAQRKLGDKFGAYAEGSPLWTAQEKAAADLEKTIAAWRENFAAAGKSEAELNAAIGNLKEEYRRKQLQEFMDANNLKVREEQKLTAEEEYTQTLQKIKEAEEQYGLEAAQAEKLRAQAETDYADALQKKADEDRQQKESRLNDLGINALREQVKTPWEKYLEQQKNVNQAAEEGLISATEAQRLNAKLAEDYYKNNAGEPGAYDAGGAIEEKAEEYKRASTMTAGSNELYQAMTQRDTSTERYQNDVKKNLTDVARYTEDNYDALQAIQSQLGDVMRAIGVV